MQELLKSKPLSLDFYEKFLSMRASLSAGSRVNVRLDRTPLFSIEFEGFKEAFVLFSSPATLLHDSFGTFWVPLIRFAK